MIHFRSRNYDTKRLFRDWNPRNKKKKRRFAFVLISRQNGVGDIYAPQWGKGVGCHCGFLDTLYPLLWKLSVNSFERECVGIRKPRETQKYKQRVASVPSFLPLSLSAMAINLSGKQTAATLAATISTPRYRYPITPQISQYLSQISVINACLVEESGQYFLERNFDNDKQTESSYVGLVFESLTVKRKKKSTI